MLLSVKNSIFESKILNVSYLLFYFEYDKIIVYNNVFLRGDYKLAKRRKRNDVNIDLTSVVMIIIGIISGVVIYSKSLGKVGSFIKYGILGGLFGKMTYALPFILITLGFYAIFRDFSRLKVKTFQVVILAISIAGLFSIYSKAKIMPEESVGFLESIKHYYLAGSSMQPSMIGGGIVGGLISIPVSNWFNDIVAMVILWGLTIFSAMIITGITISTLIVAAQQLFSDVATATKEEYANNVIDFRKNAKTVKPKNSDKFRNIVEQTEVVEAAEQLNFDLDDDEEEEEEEDDEEEIVPLTKNKNVRGIFKSKKRPIEEEEEEEADEEEEDEEEDDEDFEENEELEELNHGMIEEYEEYEFPPISLLNESKSAGKDYSTKELRDIAIKLQKTLASFGVDAKVTNVTRGPTVTRYELQPNVGVKVSKILRLSDDIALNLAAKSIRIEAPIPGKSAVGIEVPNRVTDTVSLREILESDAFVEASSKVSFGLGKSIDGEPVVANIAKMPHMLIAGSTGSGKSVCINSIIMSILYKANPSEVKLILVDPKVVELGVYNGIPHLLIPVVTDPKKAAGALNWAVQEMVNRYNLFASKGVRDIKGYNELLQKEGEEGVLPQVVIIIDELADLMMVAPNEVEDAICRLAQMARAAGMHLIIATQRPSVDVITGIIKANIPSRIAFTVSSQVDSRTILDMGGAEKLLGRGDMLYNPIGESKPIRVQGSFVSDAEIESVVDYIKEHNEVRYNESVIETLEKSVTPQSVGGGDEDDTDEFLEDAIDLAVNMGQVSASMIQRKFKVGYARAGRIVDQMEERGIISGHEGSKPRQVLISKEEWEEMKEQGETEFDSASNE